MPNKPICYTIVFSLILSWYYNLTLDLETTVLFSWDVFYRIFFIYVMQSLYSYTEFHCPTMPGTDKKKSILVFS